MLAWVYDPQSGGSKISPQTREVLCRQADSFANTRPWFPRIQLKLRFKNQFCYVDTIEAGERVLPLSRLRHFKPDRWSLALFMYSNDRYEPTFFPDGKSEGTFEMAMGVCDPFIT